jgi:hypothetical protein
MAATAARLLGDVRTAARGAPDPVDAVAERLTPAATANPGWTCALLTGFAAQQNARTNRMMVLLAAAVNGPFATPSPGILTAIGVHTRHGAAG